MPDPVFTMQAKRFTNHVKWRERARSSPERDGKNNETVYQRSYVLFVDKLYGAASNWFLMYGGVVVPNVVLFRSTGEIRSYEAMLFRPIACLVAMMFFFAVGAFAAMFSCFILSLWFPLVAAVVHGLYVE